MSIENKHTNLYLLFLAIMMILGTMIPPDVCSQEYGKKEPDKTYDVGYWVSDIDMTRDGEFFVISTSQNISWYRMGEDEPEWISTGPGGGVKIAEDGNHILSCRYNTVHLYNTSYDMIGMNVPIFQYQTEGRITDMDIADDGQFFTVADDLGNIYVFEIQEFIFDISLPKWRYNASHEITSIAMSGDGKYLAAGTDGNGNILLFFSTESSTPIWIHRRDKRWSSYYDLDISQDGSYIAAYYSCGVALFSKTSNQTLWKHLIPKSIEQVRITPDGNHISYSSSFGDIILLDSDGHKIEHFITTGFVDDLSMTADGKYIASHSTESDFQNGTETVYTFFSSKHDKWRYQFTHQRHTRGSITISDDAKYVMQSFYDKVYLFINENLTVHEDKDDSNNSIFKGWGSIMIIVVVVIAAVITTKKKYQIRNRD